MTTVQNQGIDMSYLVDFEGAIRHHDAPSILRLWEEYTSSDEVDGEDLKAILEVVKQSDLRDYIGRHIERCIPLWEKVEDPITADKILELIIDLQLSNSDQLRLLALQHLEKKFSDDPHFKKKMHLVGLRGPGEGFKGAISHYLLLNHLKPGNYVFHLSGWGAGEVIEVSMLREEASFEFDYVSGRKDILFKVAFQSLIPLSKEHFLARRFGSADQLEELARAKPVEVIRMLLKDLGPKTAAEIKDELCDLVIPEEEWNRWWQNARTKIKKDTLIESPSDLKNPFRFLKKGVSHEERFEKALESNPSGSALIQMVYSFLKDFSDALKNESFKESLSKKLQELLSFSEISEAEQLEAHFFLQDLNSEKKDPQIAEKIGELIKKPSSLSIQKLVHEIPIQALKKRALSEIQTLRSDWQEIFLTLLLTIDQNPLRQYILQELVQAGLETPVKTKLLEMANSPGKYPDAVIWYFQEIMEDSSLPLANTEGKSRFFEALLILLSIIEKEGDRRDLVKKINGILSKGRYQIVRTIMKDASSTDVQEFLLLITKCQSLSDHDIKIFYSLAEVAHPSLAKKRKKKPFPEEEEEEIIWTTKEGYILLQKRIEQIGTVETVDNAKEIEIARAHGDLRENQEFKAALERRDRLQTELKTLSEQLNKSRILTVADIDLNKIGVGVIVECEASSGEKTQYTLLGPWDADPDKNILSFQSKIAKSLMGLKKGDEFEIQNKKFKITGIRSAL